MNALWLLLSLLAVAYFGSILTSGRAIRGYGLPSGAEWLLVGFALGPHGLGTFDDSTIRSFEPLVIVGLGWVAMVIGIDYGYVGDRLIKPRGLAAGSLLSVACLLGVGAGVYAYLTRFSALSTEQRLLASLGLALVSCETTRHAVRWASERYRARGPLADHLADLADSDDLIPLIGLAALLAMTGRPTLTLELPAWGWFFATFGVGMALGLVAALLLARSLAHGESWAVLIGVALLAIGISTRLGLSSLSCLFALGLTISVASHRHVELRTELAPTERPVLLPILLLAGASIDVSGLDLVSGGAILVALLLRLVTKLLSGLSIGLWLPVARRAFPFTGLSLFATGSLTMSVGLLCYLELPEQIGALVLACAVATAVLGELLAPVSLRRALERAAEVPESETSEVREGEHA